MSPIFAKAVLAVFTAESIAELIEVTKTFVSTLPGWACNELPTLYWKLTNPKFWSSGVNVVGLLTI